MNEFRKELAAAERQGTSAVWRICIEALEKWGQDRERLTDLAELFLREAEARDVAMFESGRRQVLKYEDQSGTYLMMYQMACDYARNHLNQEDYHYFCERQMKSGGYL